MAKIILDIFLILLFIGLAALQVYVLFRVKELKEYYVGFMKSQDDFMRSIEKARQSLMIVNSQATDILPELKKHIEESDTLMQDFSFVLARANKKIETLQDLSALSSSAESTANVQQEVPVAPQAPVTPVNNYAQSTYQEPAAENADYDPVLARLEQIEKQEQAEKQDLDFLKSDNKRHQQQQELIEKALKEIL
jgi:DNA repair exonuclease SbcCD ATPase subunit